MDNRIKISLQHFAEDTTTPTTTPTTTQPKTPPAVPPTTTTETDKTFTQADVNNIVSRESKSAVEKLLKEAGIAPEGDYKASLKAFKDWQDSQKTELEKATGSLATLAAEKEAAETKAKALENKVAALAKGIPADKLEQYTKLAEAYRGDKTDFSAALDKALKDFPVAEAGTPGAGGNPPPTPNNQKPLPSGTVFF